MTTNIECFFRQKVKYLNWINLAFLFALINSCTANVRAGYIADDKKNTENEIEQFHARLSAEDYEAIYNNSSPVLQNSMNKNDLFKAMKNSHDDFGQFESVIDKRINVIVGTLVEIRAVYISKYSKTDLTESFVFVKEGDLIKLAFYQTSKGRSELPDLKDN